MKRVVLAIGWAWFIGPLVLLSFQIWSDFHTEFLSFEYYIVSWASLLLLAACGAWFLIGMPGAKWALRGAAVAVALYTALIGLLTEGGAEAAVYVFLGAILAFCAMSIVLAGRRAT